MRQALGALGQGAALPLGGVTFGAPAFLVLVLLVPLLRWGRRRRAAPLPALPYSRLPLLAAGAPPSSPRWWWRHEWWRHLALLAFIVAASLPRTGARMARASSEGIDITLAVDISSSMLAEDFQPRNRLEVAKEQVRRFVLGRQSDRVSLVAFSGEALTQVPLTTDYPVLLAAIDNLQAGQLADGTAIGTAIATAANRLRSAPGRSRVMVLLTDGENNRGAIDPRTAAQAAAAFGIRIYTIGVGSEGMAPVPVSRGLFGLRYENRPVKIDEPLLTEIASATGGRYFRARDARALEAIYAQINRLERSAVATTTWVRHTEQYHWPLAVGLLALGCEAAVRRRRGVLPG
ncbi:MAG: VWA domain-containing protein [Gemmatimonadetes bacterium]|nr:VWA domain-containing protein [Gemmatimonadota bacterium]